MGETAWGTRRPAAVGFDVDGILPDRVDIVVGTPGEVPGPFQGECILQAVVETLVVGPDAQHIVGPLLPNLVCNRLPAVPSRGYLVEGRDAACQARRAQQLQDGYFVGPVIDRGLDRGT